MQGCQWRDRCDRTPVFPLYAVNGTAPIGAFCEEHAQQTVRELGGALLVPNAEPARDCRDCRTAMAE